MLSVVQCDRLIQSLSQRSLEFSNAQYPFHVVSSRQEQLVHNTTYEETINITLNELNNIPNLPDNERMFIAEDVAFIQVVLPNRFKTYANEVTQNLPAKCGQLNLVFKRTSGTYLHPEYDLIKSLPLSDNDNFASIQNHVLQINKKISEGTAQGDVYSVSITSSVDKNDLITHAKSCNIRVQNNEIEIPAVLKKSSIYNTISVWMPYTKIVEYERSTDAQQKCKLFLDLRVSRRCDPRSMEKFVQKKYENLYSSMIYSFYSLREEPYVDVILSSMTSLLTRVGITPFCPLIYGTFRVHDSMGYSNVTDPLECENGNNAQQVATKCNSKSRGPPFQILVIQKLEATLTSLLDNGWFEHTQQKSIHVTHFASYFGQLIFGLACLQSAFGLVHNDAHTSNVMYEITNDNELYYGNAKITIKVPTFGKVFKLIDYGRATVQISYTNNQKLYYGSTNVLSSIDENWNSFSLNNDLLRAISTFMYTLQEKLQTNWQFLFNNVLRNIDLIAKLENVTVEYLTTLTNELKSMVQSILTATNGLTIFENLNNNLNRNALRQEFQVGPFTYKTLPYSYENAIPINWLQKVISLFSNVDKNVCDKLYFI